eukprot:601446-Hanusia_phi.AAC.3
MPTLRSTLPPSQVTLSSCSPTDVQNSKGVSQRVASLHEEGGGDTGADVGEVAEDVGPEGVRGRARDLEEQGRTHALLPVDTQRQPIRARSSDPVGDVVAAVGVVGDGGGLGLEVGLQRRLPGGVPEGHDDTHDVSPRRQVPVLVLGSQHEARRHTRSRQRQEAAAARRDQGIGCAGSDEQGEGVGVGAVCEELKLVEAVGWVGVVALDEALVLRPSSPHKDAEEKGPRVDRGIGPLVHALPKPDGRNRKGGRSGTDKLNAKPCSVSWASETILPEETRNEWRETREGERA